MTYPNLLQRVAAKEIATAIDRNGKKHRFFVSKGGSLCVYYPRCSRRGVLLNYSDLDNFVKYLPPPAPVDPASERGLRACYDRTIGKYKKLAGLASFTNGFNESCRALPDFDTWRSEPKQKSLCDYGITTGNRIDGVVISVARLALEFPVAMSRFRAAIGGEADSHLPKGKAGDFTFLSRVPFAGYEATGRLSRTEDGALSGCLSLEYKGCLNGYYYLLINDDTFIGYDVD
jgi:hypothetical protein